MEEYSKLFKIISEEAMMGFLTFDMSSKICIYANKLAKELLNLSLGGNLDGLVLDTIFPNEDVKSHEFTSLSGELIEHEGLYQGVLVKKLNGINFIANLGVKKVEILGRLHLLLMFQDVTIQNKLQRDVLAKQAEIKAAFEELLVQNKKLKELDAAKSKFLALTTHELRTPLSAMFATAEVLKLKLYDSNEQLEEFIDIIHEQGKHILELVNDILDFSKIQAGRMDIFLQRENILEHVKQVVDNTAGMADSGNIKLNLHTFKDSELFCYYDSLRFKQVLSNILSNAIKYNRVNGLVDIWLEETDTEVLVFVKDTGDGISEEEKQKVFDEFETLGKVALHHQGTGLGMPISKKLMDKMGGCIHLESQIGVGSKFWVTIPKQKVFEDDELYKKRPDMLDDLAA